MAAETQELIRICEALPEDKRAEVVDFARFLLVRQEDERWERLIESPEPRPKLEAFLRESAAEPFDLPANAALVVTVLPTERDDAAARDLGIINASSDQLNKEAWDVLDYQGLP